MRGAGFFFGTPLFLGFSGGAGFSWRRPGVAELASNYTALDLGLSLRLGSRLSVGWAWDRLLSGRNATRGSYRLGMDLRICSALALGGSISDLNRPKRTAESLPLPRRWDAELVLRPLLDRRLEILLGSQFVSTGDWHILPHARIEGRIRRGVRLFGEVKWPGFRAFQSNGTPYLEEILAFAGIRLEFGQADLGVFGMGRIRGGGGVDPGGALIARVNTERQETAVPSAYVAEVRVHNLGSERRFVEVSLLLRRLAQDPNVEAVLLKIDNPGMGLGRVEEARSLIHALRTRKKVLAWIEQASMVDYYLASACDGILMDPAGSLFLGGLKHQVTYFKSALDRLGVDVEVERIAEYKGAMEPFLFNGGSEPVRENHSALLDDEFARLLHAIGADRQITEPALRRMIDRAVYSPADAKQAGLVDEVPEDETQKAVPRWLGHAISVKEADPTPYASQAWFSRRIAVILIDGTLVDGDGDGFPGMRDNLVWSDPLVELLDKVSADSSIGAVVLRINSPGGSALASDHIAQAVKRMRKAGKPVVVSVGDVAASGGYYIAALADRIFAAPSTLTGSIGIYAYKADIGRLLGRLGISVETLRRGEKADLFSLYRPWTNVERQSVGDRIRSMYQRFVATVVEGRASRGIDQGKMQRLGGGRLWTGAQAQSVGLVDELGGLAHAIDEATRLGKVWTGISGLPEIVVLPKASPSLIDLVTQLPLGKSVLQLFLPMLVNNGMGIEARLPYDIEIR
jgi:protease-4